MDARDASPFRRARNPPTKACGNCARVKCKCMPRAAGLSCERCHRLGKICTPSEAAAKQQPRVPKRRGVSPTPTARLEQKLDSLLTALRSREPLTAAAPELWEQEPTEPESTAAQDGGPASPSESHGSATPSDDEPDSLGAPSPVEADECLCRFRGDMVVYPFLWLAIMAVASRSVKARNALSLQTRRIMIERVVAAGERNLDLLLGILTFVNWVHLPPMDKQFAGLASQLAVSIVWDLGLHMPPAENASRYRLPTDTAALGRSDALSGRERTLEEHRAVLGTFIITSTLAHTLKSADGFRWTPYMDEYIAGLTRRSALPQDQILVKEAKMQLIVSQHRYSSWGLSNGDIPLGWMDVLQQQIDEITGDTAQTTGLFGGETALLMFHHYASAVIREWITAQPATARNDPDPRRYAAHQRCMDAIRAWLDLFFALSPPALARVPFGIFAQLCYVVLLLRRLTTTTTTPSTTTPTTTTTAAGGGGDAAWNAAAARAMLDPLRTVDRIIHAFERIRDAGVTRAPGGEEEEDHALALGFHKFRALRAALQRELSAAGPGGDAGPAGSRDAMTEVSDGSGSRSSFASGSCFGSGSGSGSGAFLPGLYLIPSPENGFLWE
ncbi:0ac4db94-26a7-4e22-a804-f89098a3b643 [Thermothielavioides terrestris]|uniref:0ac4db94-26a7-4e22-a804-f89098a3b643 n=1 Tax=Thermothielavioides terrestris TaxID=2587410 RepID=A0A446B9D8_9PEZI|nr:0ac4db94-26a7-4e22-a804-f89098a3b643 [Thermothielavioides terrestris]